MVPHNGPEGHSLLLDAGRPSGPQPAGPRLGGHHISPGQQGIEQELSGPGEGSSVAALLSYRLPPPPPPWEPAKACLGLSPFDF